MSNLFIAPQVIVLLKLIFAHLLTDFFLQPLSWVKEKERLKIKSIKLLYHILVTSLFAWFFSGSFLAALFIGICHYFIDLWKVYSKDKTIKSFLLDQLFHFIILIITWLYLINAFGQFLSLTENLLADFKIWAILTSYLFCSFPLGIIIGVATQRWRNQVEPNKSDSLNEAGKWIGLFERMLTLTFVLNNQYEAIGFLIAAKALLRFKDSDLKLTEYVLIGTLISFTITILMGIFLKMVI